MCTVGINSTYVPALLDLFNPRMDVDALRCTPVERVEGLLSNR